MSLNIQQNFLTYNLEIFHLIIHVHSNYQCIHIDNSDILKLQLIIHYDTETDMCIVLMLPLTCYYIATDIKICITCANILNITIKNALAGAGISIYDHFTTTYITTWLRPMCLRFPSYI